MAQLVEQRIRNAWVAGSSPAIGSLFRGSQNQTFWLLFLFSGFSSVGRALASQAEGRGFESRNPLHKIEKNQEIVKKTTQKFAGFKK